MVKNLLQSIGTSGMVELAVDKIPSTIIFTGGSTPYICCACHQEREIGTT